MGVVDGVALMKALARVIGPAKLQPIHRTPPSSRTSPTVAPIPLYRGIFTSSFLHELLAHPPPQVHANSFRATLGSLSLSWLSDRVASI